MPDNRNNPNWEQRKNQDPKKNEERGTKEEVSNQQKPEDHLKDGTNDLQSGDPSSNLGEASEKTSNG
jgi:hypothetical protein